jgi:hypothetical protein
MIFYSRNILLQKLNLKLYLILNLIIYNNDFFLAYKKYLKMMKEFNTLTIKIKYYS